MNPPYTTDDEPEFVHHQSFLLELTCREWAILLYMADDLLNTEIAARMNLAEKSVENYHTRIGQKLNLKGKNKLARFARRYAPDLRDWYERRAVAFPRK